MSSMKIKNRKEKTENIADAPEEEEINFETKIDDLGLDKNESEKESRTDEEIFKDDVADDVELDEIIKEGM